MRTRKLFSRALVGAMVFVVACGSSNKSNGTHDAAIDAPGATPDASCFMPPLTTSNEIINACTGSNVTIIYDTKAKPPLTLPDGGLPPLGSGSG
jgi:hypothetical protein